MRRRMSISFDIVSIIWRSISPELGTEGDEDEEGLGSVDVALPELTRVTSVDMHVDALCSAVRRSSLPVLCSASISQVVIPPYRTFLVTVLRAFRIRSREALEKLPFSKVAAIGLFALIPW